MMVLGYIMLCVAFIDLTFIFAYIGLVLIRETRSLYGEVFPDSNIIEKVKELYGSYKKKRNALQKNNSDIR